MGSDASNIAERVARKGENDLAIEAQFLTRNVSVFRDARYGGNNFAIFTRAALSGLFFFFVLSFNEAIYKLTRCAVLRLAGGIESRKLIAAIGSSLARKLSRARGGRRLRRNFPRFFVN